jgi:coenzyme F420-reducing hydrogenase gamma subunit
LLALTVLTVVEDVAAAAGLVAAAGACAITGAVSMEAAMSAMATLRNMGIAFQRFACGEPVDPFDRLMTDLDATMPVRR